MFGFGCRDVAVDIAGPEQAACGRRLDRQGENGRKI
jgi:hypothetical protein